MENIIIENIINIIKKIINTERENNINIKNKILK